jgi:hypothetical protein
VAALGGARVVSRVCACVGSRGGARVEARVESGEHMRRNVRAKIGGYVWRVRGRVWWYVADRVLGCVREEIQRRVRRVVRA